MRRLLDVRRRSLIRANAVVLLSLAAACWISKFPRIHPTLWLIIPTATTMAGTIDTARCMQKRWNFYHGGVLLCIYMDLMVLTVILFFLFYPKF